MTTVDDVSGVFVAEKRSLKASWSTISRMTGVPELTLRRRFDGGYVEPEPRPTPAAEAPTRAMATRALQRQGMGPDEARVLARLWQANGRPVTSRDLARGIIGGGAAPDLTREARRAGVRIGLSFDVRPGGGGICMTPGSVVKVSALIERDRS